MRPAYRDDLRYLRKWWDELRAACPPPADMRALWFFFHEVVEPEDGDQAFGVAVYAAGFETFDPDDQEHRWWRDHWNVGKSLQWSPCDSFGPARPPSWRRLGRSPSVQDMPDYDWQDELAYGITLIGGLEPWHDVAVDAVGATWGEDPHVVWAREPIRSDAPLWLVASPAGVGVRQEGPDPEPQATPPVRDEEIKELIARLDDDDADVRYWAIRRVSELATAAEAAAPALIARLDDEDDGCRFEALIALGSIGVPAVRAAVPSLLHRLDDSESAVRQVAVRLLGESGKTTSQVAEALINRLRRDDFEFVRNEAAKSLGRLRATPALEALLEALARDPSDFVRASAADAVGRLGDPTSAALEALRTAAEGDPDEWVRREAARALEELERA
jgi:HEAT repeat protein